MYWIEDLASKLITNHVHKLIWKSCSYYVEGSFKVLQTKYCTVEDLSLK